MEIPRIMSPLERCLAAYLVVTEQSSVKKVVGIRNCKYTANLWHRRLRVLKISISPPKKNFPKLRFSVPNLALFSVKIQKVKFFSEKFLRAKTLGKAIYLPLFPWPSPDTTPLVTAVCACVQRHSRFWPGCRRTCRQILTSSVPWCPSSASRPRTGCRSATWRPAGSPVTRPADRVRRGGCVSW